MRRVIENLKRAPRTLLIVFFISIVLRTLWLDRVPNGISDDELGFIINAKSVFFTGHDIMGKWSPISLRPITGGFPQAELPYLIMAPFIGILPYSLFYSKLPYALLSSLTVILLYLIVFRIIGKKAALFVGLLGALNPWSIIFGRTSYEAGIAVFFYILFLYLIVVLKNNKIFFAVVPLFLGFYSYMGTKIIFLPFIIISIIFSWKYIHEKKYITQYLLVLVAGVLVFLYFVLSISNSSTSDRLSEISSPKNALYENTVNLERKNSISTPLNNIFSNKIVSYSKDKINKYLDVVSVQTLFAVSDSRDNKSLWNHGYFYYFEVVFLIIGICFLFYKNRPFFVFTLFVIFISPLPAVLSGQETGFYGLRAGLMFPFLIIVCGLGGYFIFEFFKKRYFFLTIIGFASLYLIGFLNFSYIYYFARPVYTPESHNLSSRVLSYYLKFAQENTKKVVILSDNPRGIFFHFMFYSNIYQKNIPEILTKDSIRYKNFIFSTCKKGIFSNDDTIIALGSYQCNGIDFSKQSGSLAISQISDGGIVYKIIRDKICSKYDLERYPYNFLLSDFDFDGLSEKRFCQKFITSI